MKRFRTFASLLLLTAAACTNDSEVFYSVTYPIVRIEAEVTLNTTTTADEGTSETPAIVTTIMNDITQNSPVQNGGSYKMLYSRANGGKADIKKDELSDPIVAIFVKVPGSTDYRILYETTDYTLSQRSYTEESVRKVMFESDLTAHYQALYPDADLKKAVRKEYTATEE